MSKIDLSAIAASNSEEELVIPGIGNTGFFVSIRHSSDKSVQSVDKSYQNKVLADAKKGGKKSGENLDWYKLHKLATHIAGWRWTNPEVTVAGVQPEYSPEKAIEFIKGDGPFSYYLRQLVDSAVGDDENFLAKPV